MSSSNDPPAREGVAINGNKSILTIFAGLTGVVGAVVIPAILAFVWLGRVQIQVENNVRAIATLQAEAAVMQSRAAVLEARQTDVRERLSTIERLLREHDQETRHPAKK